MVGDVINNFLCFLAFLRVPLFWMFHFRKVTRWMPRYVYGLFCVRIGKGWFFKWICCACMYALTRVGFNFDLFGHPVIAHLEKLRSMCAHYENFWSKWICG